MKYELNQKVYVLDTDGMEAWLPGTVYGYTHHGKVRVMCLCGGMLDVDPKDSEQIKEMENG